MEGLIIFISNITQLITVVTIVLVSGWYVNGKNSLSYKSAFTYLFVGLIAFTTIFAIYKTGGKTIMLGFTVILLGLFRELRMAKSQPVAVSQQAVPVGLGILAGLLFTFTWTFFTVIQFDEFPYHISRGIDLQQNDYLINVLRSFYLGLTGEENYYHVYNLIDTSYNGTKPYHYLEMWTPAALTSLFGGLISHKFVLISNPLFLLMSFVGIMALWEKYINVKWYHLLFTSLAFFMAGLHLPFYDIIGIDDFSIPLFTHRIKMVVYYPFILGFLIYFKKDNLAISLLFLAGLILATIVVAPAILGGFLFLLLFLIVIKKKFKEVLSSITYITIIVAFIFIFYKLTDRGSFNIRANSGIDDLLSNMFSGSLSAAVDKTTSFFCVLLKEFILYLPLVFFSTILYWKNKSAIKSNQNLLILSGGIVLSGALAFIFFEPQKDANQLFYNISNSLLNCLSILAVIYLVSQREKLNSKINLSIVLLCLLVCSLNCYKALKRNIYPNLSQEYYAESYLENIETYVKSTSKINMGAAIKGGTDYNSSFSKQTAAYSLGYYLPWMENGAVALNISDFDIPDTMETEMASNLFYRFVSEAKKSGKFTSIEKSQIDFIKIHQLDFIVLSASGLLRDKLSYLIRQEFVDSISKERFLIIDRSKF